MRYFLIFMSFLFLTAEAPSPWGVDEVIGKKAPDSVLKDLTGKNASLSSFRGKVVLINFWATWCPPCRSEMPSLNKLYKEYRDKGLVVMAVSTDRNGSTVRDYLNKNPVDLPIFIDSDLKISRLFKVFSMPTTFLIDRNGIILQRYLGEEDWDSADIRGKIKEALGIQ